MNISGICWISGKLKRADEISADPGNLEAFGFGQEHWTNPPDLEDNDSRMIAANQNYRSMLAVWDNRGAFCFNVIEVQGRGAAHVHGLVSMEVNNVN